jgi:hypothetical protein
VVSSRLPQTLILKNISPKTALILSHLVSAWPSEKTPLPQKISLYLLSL